MITKRIIDIFTDEKVFEEIRDKALENRHFASFFWSNANLAEYVLRDMLAGYAFEYAHWSNVGAFVHNYQEEAIRTIEGNIAAFHPEWINYADMLKKPYEDEFYDTAWTEWAKAPKRLKTGVSDD